MGMWEFEAWGNDSAADWFADLMDSTNLRQHWVKGIEAEPEEEYEEVRAAIWLFAQLGRTYVWPIDHLDTDIETTIKAAEALLATEWLQEEVPEFLAKVSIDLDQIKVRRKT